MASDPDTDDTDDTPAPGVFDTLLMPLRLPGRVVADIETLTQAVVALQRISEQRLSSLDDRAGQITEGLTSLQQSMDRIETRIEKLESLEVTIQGMLAPMEQMAGDVAKIDGLLPNPSDGPLTRLKDTLSSGN